MDEVLAMFVIPACLRHGRPFPYDDPAHFGVFGLQAIWGITAAEFWKPLDTGDFWHQLPKTPEADAIVELAVKKVGVDNVGIMTAPALDPYCVPQKREWIRRHFPAFSHRIIFTGAKSMIASQELLLIDDHDTNVEHFRAAGGRAILLPRPWNQLFHFSASPVEWLKQSLAQL